MSCPNIRSDVYRLQLTFTVHFFIVAPQVASDMQALMEKVCGTLEKDSSHITQLMWETLFELYMSLKTLHTFREFLALK